MALSCNGTPLFDRNLGDELIEAFSKVNVDKLLAETSDSGSQLYEAVLDKLIKSVDETKWFEMPGACFAPGTLAHTKDGLVPIEQIKVGDYVLSKPESGEGEQAYKRVTQVFAHKPERVIRLTYFIGDDRSSAYPINTTLNHPFWAVGKGWTAAEDLKGRWAGDDNLELCDGSQAAISSKSPIYISDQAGVGWLSSTSDNKTDRPGALWDYMNQRLVATNIPPLKDFEDVIKYEEYEKGENANSFYLKLPVYNLEVEDFHTYYVGKHGVWVHNKNGSGLEFTVRDKQGPLPA